MQRLRLGLTFRDGGGFQCQCIAFLPAGDDGILFLFLAIDGTPPGLFDDAAFCHELHSGTLRRNSSGVFDAFLRESLNHASGNHLIDDIVFFGQEQRLFARDEQGVVVRHLATVHASACRDGFRLHLAFPFGQSPDEGEQPKAVPTRRSVDGSKVTDHHALLVTGEKPLFLSKEDNTVYQMVAGRMIEAFSEKCVKDTATVTAECAGVEFTVKGSVIRQAGWRAVYGEEDKEETAIPGWREGDTLTLKGCSITEGKTKPKPLHTEATLLSAMETAGKDIEDDALRQALKDCGIGTPATRAAIIETLFKRGYMERCKKSLVPTEKGLALYSVVKTMRIADVAMTGEWEKNLARIERGELPADTFCKEIEAYTKEITSELLSCDKLFARRDSGCKCPKCGTGSMQFYGKVVRCDNADCGLPVFRLKANRTLSDDEIKELLTDGHTKPLKGFKSKQGKSFDAIVAFDGDYNTTFVFPERKTSRKFSGRKK